LSPRKSFFQTAWVVDDVEASARAWAEQARVGPFFLLPHLSLENPAYRGRPSTIDISLALAQVGPMQIELIQQHDDGPSQYRDSVPAGHNAMHHVAAFSDDLDADLAYYEQIGVEVAFSGLVAGTRVLYFDTHSSIGCMTELVERTPSIEELFGHIAEAGATWDGTEPIRLLTLG
jgi:hypothetical protein